MNTSCKGFFALSKIMFSSRLTGLPELKSLYITKTLTLVDLLALRKLLHCITKNYKIAAKTKKKQREQGEITNARIQYLSFLQLVMARSKKS